MRLLLLYPEYSYGNQDYLCREETVLWEKLKSYRTSVPHRNKSPVFGNTDVGSKQTSKEQQQKKAVGMGGCLIF